MKLSIAGIGVLGPGLQGWEACRSVLRGERAFEAQPLEVAAPAILSPRERRRSSPTVKMALTVAAEAVAQAGLEPQELATVFGSANGSGLEIHKLLEALSTPEMLVSPTHFHNSVHNSAASYWCIATSCHQPSTSIAAHDYSFAASLLKAAVQVKAEDRPVLLTVFDCPMPEPLHSKRPIAAAFAVALVLVPNGDDSTGAAISLSWKGDPASQEVTRPSDPGLADLWQGTPAARSLPLLEALACNRARSLSFRYPEDGRLELEVTPC